MKLLKWVAIGFGALVAFSLFLAVIAVIGGSPNDNNSVGQGAPAAVSADTGRMSGGELDEMVLFVDAFKGEADNFGGQLAGKCVGLARAGELAAYSDCVADAYSGIESKGSATYSVLSDLIDATAKGCRQSVRRLRSATDRYSTSLEAVKLLGENLSDNVGEATDAAKQMRVKRATFDRRHADTLQTCSPRLKKGRVVASPLPPRAGDDYAP